MKKALFISFILVGALLLFFDKSWSISGYTRGFQKTEFIGNAHQALDANQSSVAIPKSKQESVPKNTAPPELKDIVLHGQGAEARKAVQAMAAFLATWNPIGHSMDELTIIFGNPSKVKKDMASYYFDNGVNGFVYQFKLHDGKVVAAECVSY
jgi:hypothetical protein